MCDARHRREKRRRQKEDENGGGESRCLASMIAPLERREPPARGAAAADRPHAGMRVLEVTPRRAHRRKNAPAACSTLSLKK